MGGEGEGEWERGGGGPRRLSKPARHPGKSAPKSSPATADGRYAEVRSGFLPHLLHRRKVEVRELVGILLRLPMICK